MDINIRPERSADHAFIRELIEAAFKNEAMSDHREHLLVDRLRKSAAYVSDLALVAEHDGEIVGHILLTKLYIIDGEQRHASLALAPVSVLPRFQGLGIGSSLIRAAHDRARALGYSSIVLLGHEDYYPRFGYRPAHKYGITFPFDAPLVNCMAMELKLGALENVRGKVEYPAAFFE